MAAVNPTRGGFAEVAFATPGGRLWITVGYLDCLAEKGKPESKRI